jgi:PncC family amidohydrolase
MSMSHAEAAAAARAVALLTQHGMTLALAESCTGGLVGDLITDVPGSSRCFLGGVVAYANEAKLGLLGVPQELIASQGSVSEETALAMARGVRECFGAGLGIATTGIAGPGGGTPQKPVGLTFIAADADGRSEVRRCLWSGDRRQNKLRTAAAALELILRFLSMADN